MNEYFLQYKNKLFDLYKRARNEAIEKGNLDLAEQYQHGIETLFPDKPKEELRNGFNL